MPNANVRGIDSELYAALKQQASARGLSLNAYMLKKLAAPEFPVHSSFSTRWAAMNKKLDAASKLPDPANYHPELFDDNSDIYPEDWYVANS